MAMLNNQRVHGKPNPKHSQLHPDLLQLCAFKFRRKQNINIQKIYNIGPMNHLTLEQNYAFNATPIILSHAQKDGFGCFWSVWFRFVFKPTSWNMLNLDHLIIFAYLCIITSYVIYHVMLQRRGRCLLLPVVACVHLRAFMGNGPAQHRLRSKKSTEPSGAATGRAGAELLGVKEDFLGIFPLGKAACAIGSTPILP